MKPKTEQERSQRRRTVVTRLRRERRPVGPPRMGFKHRGSKGSRRMVPDDESREVAREIVYARDVLGLSWDRVSDHVDRYLARKHDRQPSPRWNRPGWTKPTCHRWYYRQKALQASDGQTDDRVFRRCKTCGQSKPITEFSLHNGYRRRECKPCRAIRGFRQREAERREQLVGGFDEIAEVLTNQSPDLLDSFDLEVSPARYETAQEILQRLGELCGDTKTIVRVWKEAYDRDAVRNPGSRRVLRHFKAVSAMLAAAHREERAETEAIRALTDEELDNAIRHYLLLNASEAFVEDCA